ncbi:MAG TPA: hypothetical protein DD381_00205 [Lentisphaeria bacterium]|nr:MAG: hypothetical protein A2X47_05560 [Lentisphaerae bacterium GWF2_38_69]HBM14763.1 hypothetical protein [Lentisphaeria bacterium]
MAKAYFLIEPHYTDLDTYCTFTVGNNACRSSIDIYAADYDLHNVAKALVSDRQEKPYPEIEFDIGDEDVWMDLCFTVIPTESGKILRTIFINDHCHCDDLDSYRSRIDLELTLEDAAELSEEITKWLKNPDTNLIWNN